MFRLVAAALVVLAATPAFADANLDELLDKGPVVSVETDDKGKFALATALIRIDAPAKKVWETITGFDKYVDFMPKVVKSNVTAVEASDSVKAAGQRQLDLALEIEVPGSNPDYTIRYTLDDAKHEAKGQWQKGDLKGLHTHWRVLESGPNRTLVYYSTASKNFSSLAQSLEDEQQTITVGVNVSAALATVKAIKRRAEEKK